MFKNKTHDGLLNLCGPAVSRLRNKKGLSQRELADVLQNRGLDIGKNAIQQIEARTRFVTDIELAVIAGYFEVSLDTLVKAASHRGVCF